MISAQNKAMFISLSHLGYLNSEWKWLAMICSDGNVSAGGTVVIVSDKSGSWDGASPADYTPWDCSNLTGEFMGFLWVLVCNINRVLVCSWSNYFWSMMSVDLSIHTSIKRQNCFALNHLIIVIFYCSNSSFNYCRYWLY